MPAANRPARLPPPPGLVRMRLVATALLVLMAAVFLTCRWLGPVHPAIGFVRAFAGGTVCISCSKLEDSEHSCKDYDRCGQCARRSE